MKLVFGLARFLFLALLIFSIIAFSIWLYLNPTPHRQQLFLNGTVLTMDAQNTISEAVLVENGRIIATGTDEAMDDLSSFDAVIVDLKGKTLLPGFIEAHGHFPAPDSNPDPSRSKLENIVSALTDNIGEYLIQGVTTVQNGATSPQVFVPLTALTIAGLVPQRVVFWPNEKLAQQLEAGEFMGADGGIDTEKITTSAVKLYVDGHIHRQSGYLSQPYLSEPESPDATSSPLMEQDKLNKRVAYWHKEGWQLAIHTHGDAAIDMALDAIAAAQQEMPRNDTRHILVHAQMTTEIQLERMADLGVTPSFFPAQIYYFGDRFYNALLGENRSTSISPLHTAVAKNVRFSIHSDTPVTPIDPISLVSYSVHRKTMEGRVLGADEQISVLEALRATTIDAAWQIFREDDLGSIEPGKLADFVVLSDNPLENSETLEDIQVVQTWIGGVKRFDRMTER